MNLTEWILASGLTPDMVAILAIPFGLVMLLLIAAFSSDPDRKRYLRLLARASGERDLVSEHLQKQISVRLEKNDSKIPLFDRLIKTALPRREELLIRLERTGLQITLGTYLTTCFIVMLIAFVGLWFTELLPMVAVIFGAFTIGLGLPHLVIGFLGKRRQNAFIANFPEAIDLMTRGLKSGLPITESIKVAGEEVPNPVGIELRKVSDAVRLGSKLEDVLWETSTRLGLQEFKFFTIALSIQSETGGNLTETLQNLSEVLRRRRQLKLKVKALSSEAKASAYIIGSLPFVMTLVIYMINPGYISVLVTDPRGHVMLGLGFASFFVGAVVMFKMVRFDY